MHIVDCVFRHSSRQRPFCPIRFLRALRQFQTEIAFHQRSETKFANTKETRCNQRIEDRVRGEIRSEEHTSELQSQSNLVCRLLLEKKKTSQSATAPTHNSHCLLDIMRTG